MSSPVNTEKYVGMSQLKEADGKHLLFSNGRKWTCIHKNPFVGLKPYSPISIYEDNQQDDGVYKLKCSNKIAYATPSGMDGPLIGGNCRSLKK